MLNRASVRQCFEAWGGSGRTTRLFEQLDEEERARLRRSAALWSNEEPWIVVRGGRWGWTLLTNQRLIRSEGGRTRAYEYCDVLEVSAVVSAQAANGHRGRLAGSLEFATAEGWHPVPAESDSSFVALWNLLSLLVAEARLGLE